METLTRIFGLGQAIATGCWLGVLSRKTLQEIDQYYYDRCQRYRDKDYRNFEYNRSGLNDWEATVLESFPSSGHFLISGVGGGREVLALRQMGYQVSAGECHPQLRASANALMAEESFATDIQLLDRDEVPKVQIPADAAIVGWGSYMLIEGRKNRVAMLRSFAASMKADAPILLSFFVRSSSHGYRHHVVRFIANIFRLLTRRTCAEVGDDLAPNFVHKFTEAEIKAEMNAAGFELEFYANEPYGHAWGRLSHPVTDEK